MTEQQTAIFVEERKWDYRSKEENTFPIWLLTRNQVFGFTAALLEGLPVIGLLFTISNRIGAAMWAHGAFIVHRDCCS
jgi:hypothetical protein